MYLFDFTFIFVVRYHFTLKVGEYGASNTSLTIKLVGNGFDTKLDTVTLKNVDFEANTIHSFIRYATDIKNVGNFYLFINIFVFLVSMMSYDCIFVRLIFHNIFCFMEYFWYKFNLS